MRLAAPFLTAALVLSPLALVSPAHASPYQNCAEAYAAGHSNIPKSSPLYADYLDRDKDGVACDDEPAGFVQQPTPVATPTADASPTSVEEDLAETGGSDATPYIVGASVLFLGGGTVLALRRRRQY